MKLYGRITVFGEYLVKDRLSSTLCLKSSLFLSNEIQDSVYVHPQYSLSSDKTMSFLKDLGIERNSMVFGNLPLGYGLSSSTILTMLHLNSMHEEKIVTQVDKRVNDFSPSELDYVSISKQTTGLLCPSGWKSIDNLPIAYSLVIMSKEKKRELTEIQLDLSKSQADQIKLANQLTAILLRTGELDLDLLYDYCKLLLSSKIYSTVAMDICTDLISKGSLCKCIGGLYDKAILIIHPDSAKKTQYDKYITENFSNVWVAE